MVETTLVSSGSVDKKEIIEKLLNLAQEEHQRGNRSVTPEKINQLEGFLLNYQSKKEKDIGRGATQGERVRHCHKGNLESTKNKYPPLFEKFTVAKKQKPVRNTKPRLTFDFSLKSIEATVIEYLEMIANILDNLHLFSRLPMFPQRLLSVLKQTNKLWVLILVFLIRKTVSQLLNVISKERKVNSEYGILRLNKNSKLVYEDPEKEGSNIFKKYDKVLKDLRFDKMMLILELMGNSLDMLFNVIELRGLKLPDWLMTFLNFVSMAMTVYRMNKDDEYIDDDITEDLI